MGFLKAGAAVLLGYLLGAIPIGHIIGRALKGVDVSRVASGRPGASNVLRAAGWGAAVLTAIGDVGKGMLATLLGRFLGGTPLATALAGSAAVVGHDYSVFLGWRGGIGTVTNIGATSLMAGPVAGGLTAVSAVVIASSRYSSLGSLVYAALLPLGLIAWANITDNPSVYVIHGLISGTAAILALRPNIRRLLDGTERKLGEHVNS